MDLTPIKQIPILDVANRLGIRVRGKKAMCFSGHDKRTPSLSFNPKKNIWRCFGACGKRGDGISLVRECLGCDFNSALAWFAQEFSVDVGPGTRSTTGRVGVVVRSRQPTSQTTSGGQEEAQEFSPDPELLEWFIERCGHVSETGGLRYLKAHGIPSEVAKRFADKVTGRLNARWALQAWSRPCDEATAASGSVVVLRPQ